MGELGGAMKFWPTKGDCSEDINGSVFTKESVPPASSLPLLVCLLYNFLSWLPILSH